ncbi:MAG: RsmF rRNA methyltransferase first C-terminal domain-containing protein [Cyclobacteriaceae bacterium]|nr:RsmF rRNA methyltransferase first C-terminal domain-containing protein [Cyclobacteriaceae bacterium]
MAEHVVTLPLAFRQRMEETLGKSYPDFLNSMTQPTPTSIRINPQKRYAPQDVPNIPWTQYGHYLRERPAFTLDPLFHAGTYYVQEASSMFLEQAINQSIDLSKPIRALDLCAAPGGKSTHLLSLLNDQSLLVSNEVIRSRAGILSENIQKWGKHNVMVTNSDPEHFQRLSGFFDLIVVDAPCSGEGLFRKDPDSMKEWSPDHVTLCANRQKRILSDVWPALSENGILIYCTCTFNSLENEDNLNWLSLHHEVEFLPLDIPSAWGIEKVIFDKMIGYRFYPHRVQGEGFFISIIRKKEETKSVRIKSGRNVFTSPSKKIVDQISQWVAEPITKAFLQFNETILMIPEGMTDAVEFLSQNLRVVEAGTALASIKHTKFIPEHALALSVHLEKKAFPILDVDHENALHYLRKENLTIEGKTRGFALVCYLGTPLGWMNILENRMNNLYPLNWRIRMANIG